jgi:hypothetical protein
MRVGRKEEVDLLRDKVSRLERKLQVSNDRRARLVAGLERISACVRFDRIPFRGRVIRLVAEAAEDALADDRAGSLDEAGFVILKSGVKVKSSDQEAV